MSKIKFEESTIEELRKIPNVKRVDELSITYTQEFKEYFVIEYSKGKFPTQIFEECGFDVQKLGKKRIDGKSKKVETKVYGIQE